MSRKRQTAVTLGLGALALLALAVITAGQTARSSDRRKYEMKLKEFGGELEADDHYAVAKWCLKEGYQPWAKKHALAAHKMNAADLRAKYLIYALTGTAAAGEGTGAETRTTTGGTSTGARPVPGGRKPVTISEEEVKTLREKEGEKAIRGFRDIQRMLVLRCATPQCHGGVGTKAKWVLALKGPVTDEMLAENFRTVNSYFNREMPDQSRLLKVPLAGEEAGHPQKSIRSKTDPLYQRVVNYIKNSLKTRAERVWDQADSAGP